MTLRSLPGITSLLGVFLILFLGVGVALAEDSDQNETNATPDLDRLEFVDDAPGTPAPSIEGAPPAPGHRFRDYVHRQVNVDSNGANIPGDAANEPSLAVDPTNPLRLAIGWRQFDTISSNFRQAGLGYSTDGGRTWTFPGVLTPGTFRSDPVLSFDKEGNFYYNSLEQNFTIDVFTSTDQGENWGAPVYAYGGDKQWMTVDRTEGIGEGLIHSHWTAGSNNYTRSLDGGDSFESPETVPQNPRWGSTDVGPDGTLYIVGADGSYSDHIFSKSTDAQDPSDPSTSFSTSSIDLGGTVTYFTGPNPNGLIGQTWIEVDPTNGHLYVCASVNPPGSDPQDVKFIRSTNGGTTWSSPVRINDDPTNNGAWQWFGTMSVAPNGRIDVVWNDTRNSGSTNISQLFYSFSTDGGATWSPNEQLSDFWNSFVGWPQQDKIGDYYHMRSDLVGADLAWAATFNNEQDVYHVRIGDYDCNQNGIGDSIDLGNGTSYDSNLNGIPDECEGITSDVPEGVSRPEQVFQNVPNPFARTTTIRFEMPETGGHARVQIFDSGGQAVRTLLDGPVDGGPNTLTWNGTDDQGRSVPAGIYFYQLDTDGVSKTKRMIRLQ